MEGDAVFFRELVGHLTSGYFFSVVAQREEIDVSLRDLRVVYHLDGAVDCDVNFSFLEAEGDAWVAYHIAIFDPTSFGVHHNGIAVEHVPHHGSLRATILVDGRQYRVTSFLQKCAGAF